MILCLHVLGCTAKSGYSAPRVNITIFYGTCMSIFGTKINLLLFSFKTKNHLHLQVLEGRPQYVEMAGNLIPITKSGDQLYISFKAFRENRLPCLVKIRDRDQEPAARVAFMKEPKVVRGELPQTPICNLNIALPDMSTVRDSRSISLFHKNSLIRNETHFTCNL